MDKATDIKITKAEAEYLGESTDPTRFDNDGNVLYHVNRAMRRRRRPSDPKYTKATHSQKIKLYGRKKVNG